MNPRALLLLAIIAMVLVASVLLWPRDGERMETTVEPAVDETASATPPSSRLLPLPVVEAPVAEREEDAMVAEGEGDEAVVEAAAVEEGTGTLSVLVVEQGTRIPLSYVLVSVFPPGEDMSRRAGVNHTNEEGRVLFENMRAVEYRLLLQRMGLLTPLGDIRAEVRAGGTTELVAEFPAREAFLFRLIDTEGNPIAGQRLRVGFRALGHFVGEEATTAEDGTFFGLGYRGQWAGPQGMEWVIASDSPVMMKKWMTDEQRGSIHNLDWDLWTNPLSLRRDDAGPRTDEGFRQDIVAIRDVVRAEAIVVNAPDPGPDRMRFATVLVESTQTYGTKIENDRFSFLAPVSSEALVVISHVAVAPYQPELHYHSEGLVELAQLVAFPDVPGPWSFEVRFPGYIDIEGRVVDPAGNGVEDVEVIASSPLDRDQADAVSRYALQTYVRVKELGWSSSRTNERGEFRMRLPVGKAFDFAPHPDTVPKEFRAHRPLHRTAEELTNDPVITLRLLYSSVIWGEVVDADGNAVPGAAVDLFSFENERLPVAKAVTDDDGVFLLDEPIAFDPPDDATPVVVQDHYLRARGGTDNRLMGFSAVTLNTAKPTTIVARERTTVVVTAPESGREPIWDYLISFTVPGLEKRANAARTSVRAADDGRILGVPRGYGRIEFLAVPRNAPGPRFLDVPEDAPEEWRVEVKFEE